MGQGMGGAWGWVTSENRHIRGGLWLGMILVLLASLPHVAAGFGSFEEPRQEWRGWIPALAIDGGLLLVTIGIQRRGGFWLWVGFGAFLVVSSYANITHALKVAGKTEGLLAVEVATIWTLDYWQRAGVILYAAILPSLAALLAEVNKILAEDEGGQESQVAALPSPKEEASDPPSVQVENLPAPTVETRPERLLPKRYDRMVSHRLFAPKRRVKNGNFPSVADIAPVQVSPSCPPNDANLSPKLRSTVLQYAELRSYEAVGEGLGITGEAARLRVKRARTLAPAWVALQLGE